MSSDRRGLSIADLPGYWDRVRERLGGTVRRSKRPPPRPLSHRHYCDGCDAQWAHEGETCIQPWAWRCPRCSPPTPGPSRT